MNYIEKFTSSDGKKYYFWTNWNITNFERKNGIKIFINEEDDENVIRNKINDALRKKISE